MPGEVDTCFGYHLIADLEQVLYEGLTVQTDGKSLVFGTAQDRSNTMTPYAYVPFVRRMLADGTPDTTFSAELPATTGSSMFHPATVVVKPDGHMIVAGSYGGSGVLQLSVQHLLPNGARDPAMHSASFWPPSSLLGWTSTASANKVLVDADGSYYVAGTTECVAAFTCDTRAMFVARFDATGTLDATFGKEGYALIKNGSHTRAIDAVRVGDTTYVLGVESEPIWVGGQESSFNRVVIGKVGSTGGLDASFGTDGVFTWYDSSTHYGSVPKAFHVNPDGSLAVSTVIGASNIVEVSADGKTATPHAYTDPYHGAAFSRFASDGSLFAEVDDYPIAAFGRFAQDGTPDATFTTATLAVPDVPAETVFLSDQLSAVEESDAWLVNGYLFMGASAKPESQMVLFRIFK